MKFIRDYGEEALKLFECPSEVDPLFFSCILLYYYSELQRESNQDGGIEANGKRGVGAAHVSSSHVEQEDDTIGSKQEPEKKGKGFSTNFPSKKKNGMTMKNTKEVLLEEFQSGIQETPSVFRQILPKLS